MNTDNMQFCIINKVEENNRNDILKVIAIISMTIDHIGLCLLPDYAFFRAVGRIAFPIFAYNIAMGYIRTSNLKKYMKRLLIFAAISQVPYMYFVPGRINIFPTLAVGLYAIQLYENNRFFMLSITLLATTLIPLQYGTYGVLIILSFYIFRDNKLYSIGVFIILTLGYAIAHSVPIQLFSIVSLLIIFKITDWKLSIRINKYFFYLFYPVHIFILLIIKAFIM